MKNEMSKRFDERFPRTIIDFEEYYEVKYGDDIKSFIQSELDLAVAEERKRIVRVLEETIFITKNL